MFNSVIFQSKPTKAMGKNSSLPIIWHHVIFCCHLLLAFHVFSNLPSSIMKVPPLFFSYSAIFAWNYHHARKKKALLVFPVLPIIFSSIQRVINVPKSIARIIYQIKIWFASVCLRFWIFLAIGDWQSEQIFLNWSALSQTSLLIFILVIFPNNMCSSVSTSSWLSCSVLSVSTLFRFELYPVSSPDPADVAISPLVIVLNCIICQNSFTPCRNPCQVFW